ncbi:GRAS family protein TF80-like [Lotus japonicus]|uniref:GRAS family protein TF80-like n=1 Tax=Lotus japonicus TaxID=34305 RepID=UPI0025852C58|nr:GRAS family protein TF80-like [Lotus japonicus]
MNQYAQMLGKQNKNKNKINSSPDSALSPLSLSPPKMECFLNGLWKLQPKVMVITEQEANVNGSTLTDRMENALQFYGALFDCLEATFPRTLVDRTLLEKMLLGKQIKNIIACEGVERKERYEVVRTWIPRLQLAGFGMVSISPNGMIQAKTLLQNYVGGYHTVQDKNCLFMCWEGRPLFSISAWKF